MNKRFKFVLSATLALGFILPSFALPITYAAVDPTKNIVNLRIIETSDLHSNVMNYDYYAGVDGATTNKYGLTLAATAIKQAKAEATNSVLFDNGDTIQGSPIADYVQAKGLVNDKNIHPIYNAMNLLGYDAATVGNHEFNYGLDYLNTSIKGANFPYVNANVYDPTGKNYFTPYKIIDKVVTDEDGETHHLKVGVTGFTPPQIINWDAKLLTGKLQVEDIVKSAKKIVPEMKAAGADIVVVLSHTGILDYDQNGQIVKYAEGTENAGYYLSEVPGIDAILTGHQHLMFPNAAKPSFKDGNGIDNTKGTINGVPTVMPGSWGNNVGLIDLTIEQTNGKWTVKDGKSSLLGTSTATLDQGIVDSVKAEHNATIQYMKTPVGELKGDLNTYLGLVKDNATMEILNRAQTWYVQRSLKGTQYEKLPVLSAAAPFKAGRQGVDNYTNVKSGTLVLKNIADLYLYDNNVVNAVKVNGETLKNWLEWSAGQYNTIDPTNSEVQSLINDSFPTYNYDVIDGVTYEIDVTSKPKYDSGQGLINPDANRIKNLRYNGKTVTADMEFIVATNDYRASTNKIVNPGGVNTILKAPDSNRQAVMDYVKEVKTISASVNNNWSFTPVHAIVSFISNPVAKDLVSSTNNITYTNQNDDKGFGIFNMDLSKITAEEPAKDTTPPTITGVKTRVDNRLGTVNVAYSIDENAIVTVGIKDQTGKVVATPVDEIAMTSGSQHIMSSIKGLSDGKYTLCITAKDYSQNRSTVTSTFTIKKVVPTIQISNVTATATNKTDTAKIAFKLSETAKVTVFVKNNQGRIIATPVKQKTLNKGSRAVAWKFNKTKKGIYKIIITASGKNKQTKSVYKALQIK